MSTESDAKITATIRLLAPEYPELVAEPIPPSLREMLRIYGTHEFPGEPSNPVIMRWKNALALGGYDVSHFHADSDPWCALGQGIALYRGGYQLPIYPLWAFGYAVIGDDVKENPRMGDIAVWFRGRLEEQIGHVATIIRVDPAELHVIGANQGNSVNKTVRSRFDKIIGIRRPDLAPSRRAA